MCMMKKNLQLVHLRHNVSHTVNGILYGIRGLLQYSVANLKSFVTDATIALK